MACIPTGIESSMRAVLDAFFRICILQKKPQDLPASGIFLALVLVLYLVTGLILVLASRTVTSAVLTSVVDTTLMLLVTYGLLVIRRTPGRWLQTSTALTGTGVIFNLAAMPLLFTMAGTGSESVSGLVVLFTWLVVLLFIWNIAVIGFIYSQALSVPFPGGLLVAIVYVWLSVSLIEVMTTPVAGV